MKTEHTNQSKSYVIHTKHQLKNVHTHAHWQRVFIWNLKGTLYTYTVHTHSHTSNYPSPHLSLLKLSDMTVGEVQIYIYIY